jgi:hypothetical protein
LRHGTLDLTLRLADHHHLCHLVLVLLHCLEAAVKQRAAALALPELLEGRGCQRVAGIYCLHIMKAPGVSELALQVGEGTSCFVCCSHHGLERVGTAAAHWPLVFAHDG